MTSAGKTEVLLTQPPCLVWQEKILIRILLQQETQKITTERAMQLQNYATVRMKSSCMPIKKVERERELDCPKMIVHTRVTKRKRERGGQGKREREREGGREGKQGREGKRKSKGGREKEMEMEDECSRACHRERMGTCVRERERPPIEFL